MVGGTAPSRIAPIAASTLRPPAAAVRWPDIDFGELMASRYACSPNTAFKALVSDRSLPGVLVPCAATYPAVVGSTPDSASACEMAVIAPPPSGGESVTRQAFMLVP